MTRYEITAPEPFSQTVAGITFVQGRAVVVNPTPGALLYFRRHGYTVTRADEPEPIPAGFVANESSAKPAPRARSKRTPPKEE